MKHISRLGETKQIKEGLTCEIIEYKNYNDISVKFIETGEIIEHTRYSHFKDNKIKSNFSPTIFDVGIVGKVKSRNENGEITKSYSHWYSMLTRCYDKKFQKTSPTYINCKVCKEWLYYPNFKKWFDENYYEINDEKMCLDKDILYKHNKIYSPDNCILVPNRINVLFVKSDAIRGEYPIGVGKSEDKYRAYLKIGNGKQKNLGRYNTPEEAFYAYKQFKEQYIKEVANEYKNKIPNILYEAMYKWNVDMND